MNTDPFERLKLFVSFESPLSLKSIALHFGTTVAVTFDEDSLQLSGDSLNGSLYECSAGEYLIRGEVDDLPSLERQVLPLLKSLSQVYQVDVFEEDGRLIKRITTY